MYDGEDEKTCDDEDEWNHLSTLIVAPGVELK